MMKNFYCRVKQISKVILVSAVIVSTAVSPEALAAVFTVSTKAPKDLGCIDFAGDGWKIQLPVESSDKAVSAKEVSPAELEAGYSDDYFFLQRMRQLSFTAWLMGLKQEIPHMPGQS